MAIWIIYFFYYWVSSVYVVIFHENLMTLKHFIWLYFSATLSPKLTSLLDFCGKFQQKTLRMCISCMVSRPWAMHLQSDLVDFSSIKVKKLQIGCIGLTHHYIKYFGSCRTRKAVWEDYWISWIIKCYMENSVRRLHKKLQAMVYAIVSSSKSSSHLIKEF